jgi:hypothetical protein
MGSVGLEDDSATGFGSNDRMNAARTDQNDVIFSESYELVVEI